MSVVNPISLATSDQPIGLRNRPDLIIRDSQFQGETSWVVKDPLAMKYFRLRKPEYLVLQQLDGKTSYQQIKQSLEKALPEFKIHLSAVQQLVVSLHQYGLLISEASGQAWSLEKRRRQELQQKTLGMASSLIALRLPGWDPEPFLNWLYPHCRWFFSTWFTALVIAVCLAAVSLILTNFATFQAKLPKFELFFHFDNLLFMGLILMATKSIHELGHGLMCKHFGGECHEIGFMLLVLMPAMYCNTTDSWVLPNRWHRMAIGAAGMYVELFLAAVCTFIWWFTHPSWIHYLALNVMFLSSASTIVFNANPLLRYDGYYILSDFLEIPNLAQKSKAAMLSVLRVGLLGMKPIDSRRLPERNLLAFALYSILSFIYRWMILILILWFVAKVFEPYGLAPIGHLIIVLTLLGIVVVPFSKMVAFFLYPGRLREVHKFRFYSSIACLAAVLGFVSLYPLPHYVWGNFVVRPCGQQQIVLNYPGRLMEIVTPEGSLVEPGQVIAVVENESLELEQIDWQVRCARLRRQLAAEKTRSSLEREASSRIGELATSLANAEQQLRLLEEQLAAMTLIAGQSGKLFPPRNRPSAPVSVGDLSRWSGTPLSGENRGGWFDANTVFGVIGDPQQMEAVIVIAQSDIQLVQPGQAVLAGCQQFTNQFLHAKIMSASQDELRQLPPELSQTNGGPIAAEPAEHGERPLLTAYTAVATFEAKEVVEQNIELLPGMRGQARILVGHASLAARLQRLLSSIIRFR